MIEFCIGYLFGFIIGILILYNGSDNNGDNE